MSFKGSVIRTPKVPCPECGKDFTKPGLTGHMRLAHGQKSDLATTSELQSSFNAALRDVQIKCDNAEAKIKEFKAALSDAQNNSDSPELRKTIIRDWLNGVTSREWEEIGTDRGYLTKAPTAKVCYSKPLKVLRCTLMTND